MKQIFKLIALVILGFSINCIGEQPPVQNLSKTNLDQELLRAVFNKQIDKTKLLLDAGASPNVKDPRTHRLALIYAVFDGQKEIVHFLLTAGANPNARDTIGRTALTIAAFDNDKKLVDMLLEAKADPNLQQDQERRYTALMWAAYHNNPEIAESLLKAGAKRKPKNSYGETALNIAEHRNSKEVANLINAHLGK